MVTLRGKEGLNKCVDNRQKLLDDLYIIQRAAIKYTDPETGREIPVSEAVGCIMQLYKISQAKVLHSSKVIKTLLSKDKDETTKPEKEQKKRKRMFSCLDVFGDRGYEE